MCSRTGAGLSQGQVSSYCSYNTRPSRPMTSIASANRSILGKKLPPQTPHIPPCLNGESATQNQLDSPEMWCHARPWKKNSSGASPEGSCCVCHTSELQQRGSRWAASPSSHMRAMAMGRHPEHFASKHCFVCSKRRKHIPLSKNN